MATKAQRREATENRMKAMSHQLRAEAFKLIRERGTMSPIEVANDLEADVKDITYHIRQLEKYGCVEEVGTRPVRGAIQHFFHATEMHMVDTDEWDELVRHHPVMAEVLVDDFMQSIVDDFSTSRRANIVAMDDEFWITRNPLVLDPVGVREAQEAAKKYEEEMFEIAVRSHERRIEEGTSEIPVSSSIALFKMPRSNARSSD